MIADIAVHPVTPSPVMTAARREFAQVIALLDEARSVRARAQESYDTAAEAAEVPLVQMVADRRAELAGMNDNPVVQGLLQRLAAIETDIDSVRPAGETEEMRRARAALDQANRQAEALGLRYRDAHLAAVEEAVAEAVEEHLVPQLAATVRMIGVFEMIAEEIGVHRFGDSPLPAAHQTAIRIQRMVKEARESVAVRADREHAARFLAALAHDPMTAKITMPSGPIRIERVPVAQMDKPLEDGTVHLNFGPPQSPPDGLMPNPAGENGAVPPKAGTR